MNITKQTIKRIAVILTAVLLATVGVLTAVFMLNRAERTEPTDFELNHNDNVLVTPDGSSAMQMRVLRAGEKPGSPSVTDGIAITATLGPTTVENKEILWSIKWKDSSSGGQHSGGTNRAAGWGEGKNVADYVTMSAETSLSGESITLTCKQDFGEQIIVTAMAAENADVKATCTVDYCQKVKSVNYTFKYGDSSMSAPSADADGVYRVDYTGEEKSYTVECVPVYTNYTVADTFAQTIDGAFTEPFGYTAESSFSEIELYAGLINGVTEPALSADGEEFVLLVARSNNFVGNPLVAAMTQASELYPKLSETDKQHSKIKNSYAAFQVMSDSMLNSENGSMTQAARDEAKAILNSYTPPTFGTFTGNVDIESIDALLTAANACNNAGTGIAEYTITFTGVYSTETFAFKLGYTESSVKAARNMTVSLPSVLF